MEIFGISILTLILGILAGIFLALKRVAPKTEAKWDDSIIDTVEGVCDTIGVDPDELAQKSLGKLKRKVLK